MNAIGVSQSKNTIKVLSLKEFTDMKKHLYILLLTFLSVTGFKLHAMHNGTPEAQTTNTYGQTVSGSKASFVYDVDFETRFDNREFQGKSAYTPSMTIFGARLTPQIGLVLHDSRHDFPQTSSNGDVKDSKGGAEHRLMLGVDLFKDFGSGKDLNLFREMTLYYNLRKRIGKTDFEMYAGVFPRKAMGNSNFCGGICSGTSSSMRGCSAGMGLYSNAFFSDSLAFYDNNLEGLLLKFTREKAYFEVGCDWMGQYGQNRREKFMVFTSGEGKVLPFMSLGYAGYMLHYANSVQVKGLIDNILVNPYMRFDLGQNVGLQTLSLRLGWLQAMQRDRKHVGEFVFPCGGEFDQEVRKWNVGVYNRMFFGQNMMPYYSGADDGGFKYGSSLYYGDPFYRVHDDGSTGAGFYDRLELYYEPKIGDCLSIRVSALFHFNGAKYSGSQQMVCIRFNLSELLGRR